MNQMRELFESKFPLPEGVVWKDSGNYGVAGKGTRAMLSASSYRAMWQAWQAAQSSPKDKPAECIGGCPVNQICDYCQNQTAARMECGTSVSNVYEAYSAGKKAAQSVSVPVVGDVLSTIHRCKECREDGVLHCGNVESCGNMLVTELVAKPATSISAAELERLQKVDATLADAKELLLIWQSWFGSSRNRCDDAGKKLWDRIEAIAGETNHG